MTEELIHRGVGREKGTRSNILGTQTGNSYGDGGAKDVDGPSRFSRLSTLTRRSKVKAKTLVKSDLSSGSHGSPVRMQGKLQDDPAFNMDQLGEKKHFSPRGAADKTVDVLQSMGKSIVHPRSAFKTKATKTTAGQLSITERPYLSQKADLEFLQVYENLKRAESPSSSQQSTTEEEPDAVLIQHRNKLKELEAHRESLQAAWMTSRHVRRVRVVANNPYSFPGMDHFWIRDHAGQYIGLDWLKWIGSVLLYYTQDFCTQYIDDCDELSFDMESMRHSSERVVMASAAWQSWLMDVRAVYRWEDPRTTGKWLALYLVLWYTQHVMGFVYGYVIYIVLKNRYASSSVESLRNSTERGLDSTGKAQKLVELVDKHGRHNWLEHVLEDLGPYAQVQLGDLANFLEIIINFYAWKVPRRTFASLGFFAACLLLTLVTDMAFCMKIVWFLAGGSFFLCWPISSLYPKYRYLVSPFRWILWDIPTHAEWSFQYLRREAQFIREEVIKRNVDAKHVVGETNSSLETCEGKSVTVPSIHFGNVTVSSEDDNEDWQSVERTLDAAEENSIRSFRGFFGTSPGRLVLFLDAICFASSLRRAESWRLPFIEFATMRKTEASVTSKLFRSRNQLEIQSIAGHTFRIEGLKKRDEAFNTIIAFSGLRWQSLQPRNAES